VSDSLKIFDVYAESDSSKNNAFLNKIESDLHVKTESNDSSNDYMWLEMMENTIVYLDNILRNPNRVIMNEEEIVKIEMAKKITVDSIKHLSKNTNLIQEIDQETGDVKPRKNTKYSKRGKL